MHSEFEDFVLWCGFEVLAHEMLDKVSGDDKTTAITGRNDTPVGYRKGDFGIVFKRRAITQAEQKYIASKNALKRMVVMTDKYQWVDIGVNGKSLERIAVGKKPKHLLTHLSKNLVLSGKG